MLANDDIKGYKPSVNLPKAIKDLLVVIYLDLRYGNVLSRCLEGTPQNPYQAFNQVI